ncbi:hypothetical protein ACE2AJ_07620 [Aquihabitans daechungensis]|uniref:hypothetical protein n=1 Tax=Aquihabitans daechungensis TaxID=1052257 RepID=UPI003B9F0C3E
MEPMLESAILDLRAGMGERDRAHFEDDIRTALSLPAEQHDRALGFVVRSWTSRQELQDAPDAPNWLR